MAPQAEHAREPSAVQAAPEAPAAAPAAAALANGPMTPSAVLELQRTAGNAAVQRYLARQPTAPPAPPPAAASPVETAVLKILASGNRDEVFKTCMAAGRQWEAAVKAFEAAHDPAPTLALAASRTLGAADGARAWAYLRHGALRLADKLFIAGIGAGTDEETIWRLLPAVRASFTQTEQDFADSYSKQDRDSYGPYYTGTGKLLDGTPSMIADFLDDEFDFTDLDKSMALLTFGRVRPVDELYIAIHSPHVLAATVIAALEKAAREGAVKGALEQHYKETYKEELKPRLQVELAGDDLKRAQLILEGDFTVRSRIKIACEGLGTDEDEIFKALSEAGDAELEPLRKEWSEGGEIKRLITDELGGSDLKRFTAVMEGGTSMKGRLAQFGVDVDDIQGVIKAALERAEVEKAFREEFQQPDSEFRKAFTSDNRIGAAIGWGQQLLSADPKVKLSLAAELASEGGVHRILVESITTDALRKRVTDDGQLMGRLKGMDGWMKYEALLAPREDLAARSEWMKGKFKREAGLWGDTKPAQAYEDEMRELDASLKTAKDPHNLTPDERAQVGPHAAAAEASLDDFIRVRDEFDQLAIQVVGMAAGLLATLLTGGAAGPVTAALLARVALAQACASAAAVWAVKQERTTGGEAARAFAVGAVSGATQTLAAAPVARLLGGSVAGKALGDEAAQVAQQVAGKEFQSVGSKALQAALESAAGGAAGTAVDAGSRAETWKGGFVSGLGKLFAEVAQGAAIAGGMGGAIEGIKGGLFSGRAPAAGATPEVPPVPSRLERVHVERARVMLETEGMPHAKWTEVLAGMGEHAPIAKEAFAAARHEMLEAAVARLQPELQALGVKALVPPRAGFDVHVEVLVVPEGPAAAKGGAPADTANVHQALERLRAELGEGFEGRTGTRLREGVAGEAVGGVKGASTYEMTTTPMTQADLDARVLSDVVKGDVPFMVKGTTVKAGAGGALTLTVPPGKTVRVKVVTTEGSKLPGAAHTGPGGVSDAGPGRISLKQAPDGSWDAVVHVDEKLHPDNIRYVVGHELDEISGIVNKSATAPGGPLTQAQIEGEMQAGIFTRDPAANAAPTAHDHAAATELFDMWRRCEQAKKAGPAGAAEVAMIERQMARHVDTMAINDPNNANQKNYLLQQHGDKTTDWRHFVDELNAKGSAAFFHGALQASGALSGSSYIKPGALAHLIFVGPQPGPGQFAAKGLSGGHDDSQLLHFVDNSELGYAVVKDGTKSAGGNEYYRYWQYMWNDPKNPAPKKGSAGYPTSAAAAPPPGWVKAGPPKTTVKDLTAFLGDVDKKLNDLLKGRPLAVSETITGTTDGGVPFKVRVNDGQIATVFPDFPSW